MHSCLELRRAFYRLSPDVFLHPLWVSFIQSGENPSDHLIQELLQESQNLIKIGDMDGACQVLFVCAGLQKRQGSYKASLESLQQAWKLAERSNLADVTAWAIWGCCALCMQLGQFDQAIKHLEFLRNQLSEKGDWVLADLLELSAMALSEQPQTGETGETPLNWLLDWGELPVGDEINPAFHAPLEHAHGHSSLDRFFLMFSRQQWRSVWQNIVKISRGELRLEWVEKGYKNRNISSAVIRTSSSHEPDYAPENRSSSTTLVLPSPDGDLILEIPKHPDSKILEEKHSVFIREDLVGDRILLAVYCLGEFRACLNDQWLTHWPSGKGKSIFKFMVFNHPRPISKDILMDKFWRDADPDSARNNMYVAIYGLRQAFKTVLPDFNPILFEEDRYCLSSEISVWLDVEEFLQLNQSGQELEKRGKLVEAIKAYESAANLYQGDFLADDLYEEWPVPTRERLRVTYLDILDRLSRIYFDQGQYLACVNLCQSILERDNCREDTHRRLMRCYSRQGQHHLALRQYQSCVEALRSELDVDPEPVTAQLAEHIRQRDAV